MSDVCIYTANYGGYDTPRAQADQDIDVDWHYFSDDTVPVMPPTWCVHQTGPVQNTPMLDAKFWKMHPPVGYEHAIWIDANMEITSPSFAREAIDTLRDTNIIIEEMAGQQHVVRRHAFAVWKHPRRDDVAAEVGASVYTEAAEKYAPVAERMLDQSDAYYKLGLPAPSGLYACGTIVWTPDAWRLGEAWWDECVRWTPQDQVSLPFVCWALGTYPAVFPFPQIERRYQGPDFLGNRWLRIWRHL